MGAAVAFYTIFAIAPLFILVLALAGAMFGHILCATLRACNTAPSAPKAILLVRALSRPVVKP
jgi:uncharacterized BrkB/YihY/UPF0761 family membrane protein